MEPNKTKINEELPEKITYVGASKKEFKQVEKPKKYKKKRVRDKKKRIEEETSIKPTIVEKNKEPVEENEELAEQLAYFGASKKEFNQIENTKKYEKKRIEEETSIKPTIVEKNKEPVEENDWAECISESTSFQEFKKGVSQFLEEIRLYNAIHDGKSINSYE